MSKFINAIQEKLLYERRAIPITAVMTPLETSIDNISNPLYDVLEKYEISVNWRYTVTCLPQDLSRIKENCVRELCEAVYGDLRGNILRLERAIYEWDRPKMLEEIQKIREEIR